MALVQECRHLRCFEKQDEDTLLDAIVALDDKLHSGELPEEAYHQARAELKNRLKKIKKLS
jgi:hypothetical protein